MAARKPVLGPAVDRPELDRLFEKARRTTMSDDQLREQRVSFVYGNAPADSGITKESARLAAQTMRLSAR